MFNIKNKIPKYQWSHSALCLKLWTDIILYVLFTNFQSTTAPKSSVLDLIGFLELPSYGDNVWYSWSPATLLKLEIVQKYSKISLQLLENLISFENMTCFTGKHIDGNQ